MTSCKKKKERNGKERYIKSQVGYISHIWGTDRFGAISTKICTVVWADDIIIQWVRFWFQYFRDLQGSKFLFSHWLCWSSLLTNSADTAQPVITGRAAVLQGSLLHSVYYRAMHFSAYARSWDPMSSVRPSVRLSVRLWRWWIVIT